MFTLNWYRALTYGFSTTFIASKSGMTNFNGTAVSGQSNSCCNVQLNTKANYCPYMGRLSTIANIGYPETGVIIGSGTTPPTVNDYKLENRIVSSNISSSAVVTSWIPATGVRLVSKITIVNNGSTAVTIGEVGLCTNNGASGDAYCCLIERTVLDSPVTIPAGGVGQITYTVEMIYPTD